MQIKSNTSSRRMSDVIKSTTTGKTRPAPSTAQRCAARNEGRGRNGKRQTTGNAGLWECLQDGSHRIRPRGVDIVGMHGAAFVV